MHFGATLRLLRVDAGVTLRALAERIGVSSAYLSRVENGHDPAPTPDRLADIAAALHVPVGLLFELAHRVEPFIGRYLDAQPAATALLLDIARRRLGPAQLAVIRAFVDERFPDARVANDVPSVCAMLDADPIVTGVMCDDIDAALEIAATRLAPRGGAVAPSDVLRRLVARERAGSTAIGGGLALPHAAGLAAPDRAVLLVLGRPLAMPSPDDRPIDLALVLAIEGDRALAVVGAAARLLFAAAESMREAMPDQARMLAVLREAEARISG